MVINVIPEPSTVELDLRPRHTAIADLSRYDSSVKGHGEKKTLTNCKLAVKVKTNSLTPDQTPYLGV